MRKKKLLFQSDFSLLKTGFARNAKSVLGYLYSTGKYEIYHYCCGLNELSPELKQTPWKSLGCLPSSPEKVKQIQDDPFFSKTSHYGSFMLDEVVNEVKPDVYIAAQDIWGINFAVPKPWFKKIKSALWTTLDSLPILPSAVEVAPQTKNYWIWSDFATKELHKLGHKHVKTLHGAFGEKKFRKLNDKKRKSLRIENKIPEDAFVVGFVFRNQLRKSVSNLLDGYAKFKQRNPEIKNPRLLLHTNFREGWDIKKFAKEYEIPEEEILTTHICKNCLSYSVKAYDGADSDCEKCGAKKTVNTTEVSLGVDENELNEIYNIMDVYCHPFTSGGQEIPIQEAKLTELITLVTNYSCGQEMCYPEAHSLPLEWNEYREFGTGFIKASTCPESISKQLEKVYQMSVEERSEWGSKAREWTLENFSIEKIGKFIEEFIDSADFAEDSYFSLDQNKNPNAKVENIEDNGKWIMSLYKEILKAEVSEIDEGYKHWLQKIKEGVPRGQIENYFRQVAQNENVQKKQEDLSNYIDEKRKNRILFMMPEAEKEVYLCTSLLDSIKKLYPKHDIYFCTKNEYFNIVLGNENVYRVIPFHDKMFNNIQKFQKDDLFKMIYVPQAFDPNYSFMGNKKMEYSLCD